MALDPSARIWTQGLGRTAPVVMTHRYRTEVFKSDDGTPQRRASDDRPRRFLEFPAAVSDDWFRSLTREMHKYHASLWGIPDWTRKELTTTVLATSGSSVDVGTVEPWMVAGESVILRLNGRAEAYEIQTVSAPTLTFTAANTGAAWAIGTQVHPALPARMQADIQGVRLLRDHIELAIGFDVVPTQDFYIEPGAASTTYGAFEVFDIPPARIRQIGDQFRSHLESVDFGYGATEYFRPEAFETNIYSLTFVGCNAAKVQSILDVFYRARGGRGEFWMPTWEADLVVNTTASSGTFTLDVVGEDVNDAYAGSTVHRAIAVQFTDNTMEFNSVYDMSAAAGVTTLQLVNAWSQDINPATVRRVSWMPLCRFPDQMVVSWFLRERSAEVAVSIETLEVPMVTGTGAITTPVPTLAGTGTVTP